MSVDKHKKEVNIPIFVSNDLEYCFDSEIPMKAKTNKEALLNKDVWKNKKKLDSFKDDLEERDKMISIPISIAEEKNSKVRFGDRNKRYILLEIKQAKKTA